MRLPQVKIIRCWADGSQPMLEVLAPGEAMESIPLYLLPNTNLLSAREPLLCDPSLAEGSELAIKLVMQTNYRQVQLPAAGLHRIRIAGMDAIDPGEGDEHHLV